MIVRISTWVARLFIAGLLVVVVALVLGGLRLAAGPVDLGPAGPWIADRLELADGLFRLDAGDARLSLDAATSSLTLAVDDVAIVDRFGQPVLRLPGLRIGLSIGDLVAQRVTPTTLELTGLEVAVQRDASGEVSLALLDASPLDRVRGPEDGLPIDRLLPLFEPGGAPPEPVRPDPDLRAPDPAAPPVPASPPSDYERLRQWLDGITDPGAWALDVSQVVLVRVMAVRIGYQDAGLGMSGQVSGRDLRLTRDGERVKVAVDLNGTLSGETVGAALTGIIEPENRSADLSLAVRPLRVDRVAAVLGLPAPFDGIGASVEGIIDIVMTDRRVDRLRSRLQMSDGVIDWPGFLARPIPVADAALVVDVTQDGDRVEITQARVRLADGGDLGGSVTFQGVTGGAETMSVTGGLIGGGLKVHDIDRYWPLGLQEKARDWVVAQVHGGRVDGLSVAIDIRPGMLGEGGHLAPQAVQGEFAFTGIAVDYQPPLPPVQNLTGTGSFDLRGMRYLLDPGGKAGETGLALGRARVAIEGFGVKGVPTRVTVAVPVTGPVSDVLDVLALPPIEFVDPAFSDPEGLQGQAAIDLSLDLPIGVDSPEVIYSARGRIDKLAVQAAVLGLDVEQGAFAVAVDNRLARLNGKAVVGGAPFDIDWRQAIDPTTAWERRVDVSGRVDDAMRSRLGLDLAPFLTGPVGLDLAVELPRGRPDEPLIDVDADLTPAVMAVPDLGWRKPAGSAGRLTAMVHPHAAPDGADEVIDIKDARVDAGDLVVAGDVQLVGGQLATAGLARVDIGRSRLRVDYQNGGSNPDRITIRGRMLDAEPLIDSTAARDADDGDAGDGDMSDSVTVDLAVDSLRIDDDRRLEKVEAAATTVNGAVRRAAVQATLPVAPDTGSQRGPGTVRVTIDPAAAGARNLRLDTDRMDDLMAFAGLRGYIAGGRLGITGVIDDRAGTIHVAGRFEGRDYRLMNAPAIARALATASPSGVSDRIGGRDGVALSVLSGDFVYDDGVITLEDSRAHGSEIGVTAKGTIDLNRDRIDLAGTLVPLYTINSAVGRIPLIGDLLVGDEGSGVFAATYRLRGSLDDPEASVNPLAALAPGFLRNIFGAIAGGLDGTGSGTPPTGTDPRPDFPQ